MNFTAKSKKQQDTSLPPLDLRLRRGMGLGLLRLALLLIVLGSILHNSFLLAIGFGISGVLLVAWGWDAVSLSGLHYTRYFHSEEVGETTEMRAFLGETVALRLEVHNRKLLPVSWLEITDRAPASLAIEGGKVIVNPVTKLGELHTFWRVGAFQRQVRHYKVHCNQRGYHLYGPVTLTTGDGFGFFERTVRLNGGQRLIVYPKVYSAAELRLPAVQPFGERLVRQSLFEDPLRTAGIREWSPSDSMRRVHWKATAKNQRMLSRLYEPSREPQVLICLNVATLVNYWEGFVPELLERTVSVAASLGVMCADMRLPVGLLANAYWPGSDQLLRLMPGRSPEHLMRVLEMLAAVNRFASGPLEELLLQEQSRIPWGATLLVVTPVAHDALLQALLSLKRPKSHLTLFTLAEEPPAQLLPGVQIYHLPHLVADIVTPEEFQPC